MAVSETTTIRQPSFRKIGRSLATEKPGQRQHGGGEGQEVELVGRAIIGVGERQQARDAEHRGDHRPAPAPAAASAAGAPDDIDEQRNRDAFVSGYTDVALVRVVAPIMARDNASEARSAALARGFCRARPAASAATAVLEVSTTSRAAAGEWCRCGRIGKELLVMGFRAIKLTCMASWSRHRLRVRVMPSR